MQGELDKVHPQSGIVPDNLIIIARPAFANPPTVNNAKSIPEACHILSPKGICYKSVEPGDNAKMDRDARDWEKRRSRLVSQW